MAESIDCFTAVLKFNFQLNVLKAQYIEKAKPNVTYLTIAIIHRLATPTWCY